MAATSAAATTASPRRVADSRGAIFSLAAAGALGVAAVFIMDSLADGDRDQESQAGFLLLSAGIIIALTAIAIYFVSRGPAAHIAIAGTRANLDRDALVLDAALNQISQGFCVFDPQQSLAIVNRRYAEMFDIPAHWLRAGIGFKDLMELSRGAMSRERDLRPSWARAADSAHPQIFLQPMADGRMIEIDCRKLPDGGLVVTASDVSKREHTTEELRAAKAQSEAAHHAKAEFLANMSHELRTPLNAIIGFTDVMAAEMFGPLGHPNYREYVEDIRHSGGHLLQIITDILQMSKIDSGRLELHEEVVDLSAVAHFCRRFVRERAASANVRIALEFPPGLPSLRADERLVKQMLLNLLTNAVKFTPANGRVVASGERDEAGRLVLAVRDTGIGIAAGDMEKAMTPFAQVDNAYTRRQGGTGLGLPIVKSYAQLHGAELEIESEPGVGTCVKIRFPTSRVLGLAPRDDVDAVPPNENGGP